jgi:hypothetical protein
LLSCGAGVAAYDGVVVIIMVMVIVVEVEVEVEVVGEILKRTTEYEM